jgi:hypothetical protein
MPPEFLGKLREMRNCDFGNHFLAFLLLCHVGLNPNVIRG